MTQKTLWIETWADAVRTMVDACGGPKRVGSELRPDLPVEDAGEWLLKALNPARREVLSAPQMIQLMGIGRRNNCDLLAAFMLDQSGYEAPRPIQIEAEQQRVSAHWSGVMTQMSREMERLQRLQGLQPK